MSGDFFICCFVMSCLAVEALRWTESDQMSKQFIVLELIGDADRLMKTENEKVGKRLTKSASTPSCSECSCHLTIAGNVF
jgi:hypothetical protein